MCFELTQARYDERFWKDNPYKLMKPLGYQFNMDSAMLGCTSTLTRPALT
jgi:hypothetical protein